MPDPAPVVAGPGRDVGPEGGQVEFGDVHAMVPAGAVASGSTATVLPVGPIGAVAGTWFGQPVAVEHDQPLEEPVSVRWTASDVPADALRDAILAKWNPDISTWEPSTEPLTVEGNVLQASLRDFSFWTWIADVGQGAGELVGQRAKEPECSGSLPEWVRGTVDPDQDTSAAAIRVCFAPDKDSAIAVRVANNRSFTQRLTMREGRQSWAWTWAGPETFDIAAAVFDAARSVLDSPTTFLVPPLAEVAVGVGRPSEPGQTNVRASSDVDPITVLVDLVTRMVDAQSIGGLDNPLKDAFLQALFECGGKQALENPDLHDAAAVGRLVVDVLGSCGAEIVRPDSEFGARVESALQARIRANPGDAGTYAKANRFIHQLARKFAVLQVADIAFYLSDQLSNAMVGPLSWSVRVDGRPQILGAWTPSCASIDTDSNRLFRNLALQDEFLDTSREYWQFPGWAAAAESAVAPLARCDSAYRARLADLLPGDWGDPRAATIVADQIRRVVSTASRPPAQLALDFVERAIRGQDYSDLTLHREGGDLIGDVADRLRGLDRADLNIANRAGTSDVALGPGCEQPGSEQVRCEITYPRAREDGGDLVITVYFEGDSPSSGLRVSGANLPCPPADLEAAWRDEAQGCLEPQILGHLFYSGDELGADLDGTYLQEVVFLQLALRDEGHDIVVDGFYGAQTEAIVRAYQAERGLPVTGRVAEDTWEALFGLGHY